MRRLGWLTTAVLLAATAAWAQPTERVHRIGVLSPVKPSLEQFRRNVLPELAKNGIVEGRNLDVELLTAEAGELPRLARELVRKRPDLIFAVSLPAVAAAKAATDAIPIVMLTSADPITSGWAANLARPDGNVTGVTILGPDLDAKRLQMLHELVPSAERLAVLSDPAISSQTHLGAMHAVARELGVTLDIVEASRSDEIAPALQAASERGAAAVDVLASPMFNAEASTIAAAAAAMRLVTMCQWREMAEAGCLASYGPTLAESYRLAGAQIVRILRGARVGDMPIEQPTRFELVLNLRTAHSLGFMFLPSSIALADEAIE